METISTVGIDLSKRVFQICGKNHRGRVIFNRKVMRDKFLSSLGDIPQGTPVYMEACQSAHYWSWEIKKRGYEPHQIAPQFVKPYVKSQKNDARDAEGTCEAGRCESMRFVPTKSVGQLELQAMQRVRERLVHDRTALMNQIRGILAEHGVVMNQGVSALKATLREIDKSEVSLEIQRLSKDLQEELSTIEERIKDYNLKLLQRAKANPVVKRLCTIPGIGSLTALALVVLSGNPQEFKNGRQFAAFIGLVPRQVSTGGKTKLLGISKRGNTTTRALLIHGARAVVRAAVLKKKQDPYSLWIRKLYAKYGTNHTAVAVANKNARVAWRILTSNEEFDAAKLAKVESIQ